MGEERILEFLKKNSKLPSEQLSDALMDFVHNWQTEPEDDIAVLVLEYTSSGILMEMASSTDESR